MRAYPNPDFNLSKETEPIGCGKSKIAWFGPKYAALFRAAAAHDACYVLRAMGLLWHKSSKDADKLFYNLLSKEMDKMPWYKKAAYYFIRKRFYRIVRINDKIGWPDHNHYRKVSWALVRLELIAWWTQCAPKGATIEQRNQMLADIKFRYWKYD